VEGENGITLVDERAGGSNELIRIDVGLARSAVDGLCNDAADAHVLETIGGRVELAEDTSDLAVLFADETELRIVLPGLLVGERATGSLASPLGRGCEAVHTVETVDGHVHQIDFSEARHELREGDSKGESGHVGH